MWGYEDERQKAAMEGPITPDNCGEKLKLVREVSGLSRRELAEVLECSESTIYRLETKKSAATPEFMNLLKALVIIGRHKFSQLTDSERETLLDTLGAVGGTASGIAGSVAAVSVAGSVSGLSAAGITSGLAAIGGGTMLGGIGLVAAIPVAAGLAGYGLVKGIKSICDANGLDCVEVDGRYEITPKTDKNLQDEPLE
ncbi:helix-turn-helix domain-containing protein [Ruegeria faecimaris]|uniref:Helix-turn-helix domain-containing protein n=1 Tax=Ruegeria faecimaris TaxID=686389 RepID=A0A521DZA9_9RHOB|nr:helix-turn-helix transcriptional regulator [Ruegeria faecimaris]SMO77053.1 Helix-turn-helix domain-containing protein [Ruegeria faecimaris]